MNMYEAFGENLAQQVLEQIPTPVMAVNKNGSSTLAVEFTPPRVG